MFRKQLQVLIFAAAAVVPSAFGSVFTLTVDGCSGNSCGNGPFGSVSVVQGADLDTVIVTETLAAGEVFAKTGAGDALGFTLDKSAAVVSGSLTTGFTAGSFDTFSTFGFFGRTIVCTGCGNGTSNPELSGPVSFSLFNANGLTPQDFIANSGGYFFAADIGVPLHSGGFATGNVGSNALTVTATAPEPGTWAMLVGGLGLVVAGGRKRFAKGSRNEV